MRLMSDRFDVEYQNGVYKIVEGLRYEYHEALDALRRLDTDSFYVHTAIDHHGIAVRDNSRAQLIAIGKAVDSGVDDTDACPKCSSDNIANEDDTDFITCHDCSFQWHDS